MSLTGRLVRNLLDHLRAELPGQELVLSQFIVWGRWIVGIGVSICLALSRRRSGSWTRLGSGRRRVARHLAAVRRVARDLAAGGRVLGVRVDDRLDLPVDAEDVDHRLPDD